MVAFCIVQSTDGTGELGFNSTLVKYSETNPTIYSVENIHLNSGLHLWFHIRHLALRVKLLLTGKKKKKDNAQTTKLVRRKNMSHTLQFYPKHTNSDMEEVQHLKQTLSFQSAKAQTMEHRSFSTLTN